MYKINEDLEVKSFIGSEEFYKNFTGLIYTEGVKFIAEKYNAYWLIDLIGACALHKKFKNNWFWIWELSVKNSKAILTAKEDINEPNIITKEVSYTDFLDNSYLKLYQVRNTLMLPSEY